MGHQLNDKLAIIRENFLAGRATVMENAGTFRVSFTSNFTPDFISGESVYIYPETYDDTITARYDTREADSVKRHLKIEALRRNLAREITFAAISDFEEISSGPPRFTYTAEVVVDESVFFHETLHYAAKNAGTEPAGSGGPANTGDADIAAAPVAPETSLSLAEQAMAGLEDIDMKMLRQSLDMMNLRRSSTVRLALTRIFRNTVDVASLEAVIADEAGKLRTDMDREELGIVRLINIEASLAPVIELLCRAVLGDAAAG